MTGIRSPERPTLTQRVLRAGGWSFGGHALSQVIRLGSNLLMTRLLVPEMFGVMAIATMVTSILYMFSDIGLRQQIIQSRRSDEPAFLDTAWVVQIVRGFLLWLAAVLLSSALYLANLGGMVPRSSVYASPDLPLVIAVNSFAAVILGFQSTRVAMAHRNFDQRRIVKIELVSQMIAVAVMIGLGAAFRSIWVLVAGALLACLGTTLLANLWLSGHRNSFRLDRSALRDVFGFGKWAFVSSVFTVLAANGDRLLLGWFVNAEVLGFYAIATLLLGAVEGGVAKVFGAIALPALSEVARNDPARVREVYYKLRVPSDVMLLFLAGLLFAAGQLLVESLYDQRYLPAGAMLQVLALSLIAARYSVAYQVYLAVGKPRYMAIIQIVRCVSLFVLVPILYHYYGLTAALWGIALHGLAMVPAVHVFNARLGLNDLRRELLVLLALPAGYLGGSVIILARG